MIQFSPTVLFIFLLLFPVAMFLKGKLIKRQTNIAPKRRPPGPWKLPLIGNLHQLVLTGSTVPYHIILAKLAKKHGPIMHLQLGETPTVVISSPKAAQDAFNIHDLCLAQRPQSIFPDKMTYNNSGVALSPYGTHWKVVRKICMTKLLNPMCVQSFKSIREEEVFKFISNILSSKLDGRAVNLSRKLLGLNNSIISRATFGKSIGGDHDDQEEPEFVSLRNKLMELGMAYLVYQIFPSLKRLHGFTGLKPASESVHIPMDKILQNIVDEHEVRRERGFDKNADCESYGEDLVDHLLGLKASEDLQLHVTTDAIKAVIMDMLLAGIENSAVTVEWAMAELLKNPSAMKKAQSEVRQAMNKKNAIKEADIEQLQYLKCVIKETLRLHPPLPAIIRESRKDFEIQGYEILGNTKVIINAWAIGRDSQRWVNPNCFIPERFLDSSMSFQDSNYEYIPFGGGRRGCPGVAYGIASVELPLANLLYHFDWQLPNGIKSQELDMNEIYMVTAKKRYDLLVIPIPYVP